MSPFPRDAEMRADSMASNDPSSQGVGPRAWLLFTIDDQRYALDLRRVEHCLRVMAFTPLPGAPDLVPGVIDVAGRVVPVVDMRRRFGHPWREIRLSDHLVMADTGRRTVALLVDEPQGVVNLPSNDWVPAETILPALDGLDGVVALEGGVVLIHDLGRLLSLDEETAVARALEAMSEVAS